MSRVTECFCECSKILSNYRTVTIGSLCDTINNLVYGTNLCSLANGPFTLNFSVIPHLTLYYVTAFNKKSTCRSGRLPVHTTRSFGVDISHYQISR